jgi:hypothetical protein
VTAVVRGLCGAGTGPCGAPGARLFPMGWRCEAHKPGEPITVTRPPLVIAVRLDVCGCGGPLLSPLDGPTTACPDCQEVAA